MLPLLQRKSTSTHLVECYLAARAGALSSPARPGRGLRIPRVQSNTKSQLQPLSSWAGSLLPAESSHISDQETRARKWAQISPPCRAEVGVAPCTPSVQAPDPKGQPDLCHGVSIQRLTCKGWNYLAPLTAIARLPLHRYLLPGWLGRMR